MKKIILFSAILAITCSCVSQNKNIMESERLTYFSFDHHNSMAMSGEKYDVSTMKDGRIHIVIDEGLPEEKELYISDSSIFDELLAIVKEYKMDKYKKDYKPMMQVFDGDSWSLYYKYDSKRSVSSGGYMAWPKNYNEARQALGDYFKKWRESQTGVLAIDYFRFTSKNNQGRDIEYTLERGETEATVTIRDAEQNVDKSIKTGNEIFDEFTQRANVVRLKSSLYDYNPSDPDATFCTYFIRYNTGDTISGSTGYTKYIGHKESAIIDFFSRWLSE